MAGTTIRCLATDCVFNRASLCVAPAIDVSEAVEGAPPGCLTYRTAGEEVEQTPPREEPMAEPMVAAPTQLRFSEEVIPPPPPPRRRR